MPQECCGDEDNAQLSRIPCLRSCLHSPRLGLLKRVQSLDLIRLDTHTVLRLAVKHPKVIDATFRVRFTDDLARSAVLDAAVELDELASGKGAG